jgi:hypothetical protein
MSKQPNEHSVRRIVLPSGRTIDVVRFGGPEPPAPPSGLHVCPQCSCELVQPVSWSEAANGQWELTLRCPNCWWSADGLYGEKEVHALEDQLDMGLEDMLEDLQRLTQANMADQAERFATALQADQILPEDF